MDIGEKTNPLNSKDNPFKQQQQLRNYLTHFLPSNSTKLNTTQPKLTQLNWTDEKIKIWIQAAKKVDNRFDVLCSLLY